MNVRKNIRVLRACRYFLLPMLFLLVTTVLATVAMIKSTSPLFNVVDTVGMLVIFFLTSAWCVKVAARVVKEAAVDSTNHFNFLKIVSDNIQAPLLSMMTELRRLMKATTSEQQYLQLNKLYLQGFQLQGNINDALELSRDEHVPSSEMRVVNLQMLASDIGENYAQLLSDKPGLTLSILVDHTLPQSVKGDPRRLMHLIGNMLENSIKYASHGQIVLKITGEVSHKQPANEVTVQISCSDCGDGIEKATLERINGELRGTFDTNGTTLIGLGLRAAMNVVEQYRGTIRLSSEVGKGTTAVATLKMPIVTGAKSWNALPQSFKFFTGSRDLHVMLGNAGLFHGIRAIAVKDGPAWGGDETLLIDASDLCSEQFGTLKQFQPRSQFVVMVDHRQPRVQQLLMKEGFNRFLMVPFASTSLLQCLMDEDSPLTSSKRMSMQSSGKNILVVDDTRTSRLVICEHLKSAGHQVTEANDGLEMVALVKAGNCYDLILSDLTMTYLDGEQAMLQIKEFEESIGRSTPIVAMTAYAAIDAEKTLSAGFAAVLQKPVFLDELDYLISNLKVEEKEVPVTQFIDLDDLKERTAGKQKLMVLLLNSFIESSKSHLDDLLRTEPVANRVLQTKALHTLKGLLLETGASDCAKVLEAIEKRVSFDSSISNRDLETIKEVVEKVEREAMELQRELAR